MAVMRPWGPDRSRLGPDAIARLNPRNVLDKTFPRFAENPHFDRHHCEPFSNVEKPAVLFTACPHDPSVRKAAMSEEFLEWAVSPAGVRVDGQGIPVLGFERVTSRPLRVVEKYLDPSPPGRGVLMYREFHPDGFCKHGALSLFFGLNTQKNRELRLFYTIGEFWVHLAHLKVLYDKIGLDVPFSVFLFIRNRHKLVLGDYGDEAFRPSRDIDKYGLLAPSDPATEQWNIQLRHTFASVDEMTDGCIAETARGGRAHLLEVRHGSTVVRRRHGVLLETVVENSARDGEAQLAMRGRAARTSPDAAKRLSRACGGRQALSADARPSTIPRSQSWQGRGATAGSWAAMPCLWRWIEARRRPDPPDGPLLKGPLAPPTEPRSRIARRMCLAGPCWHRPLHGTRSGGPTLHVHVQILRAGDGGSDLAVAAFLARRPAGSAPPAQGRHLETGGGAAT